MSVDGSMNAAEAALNREAWDVATNHYLDALRQDPTQQFALDRLFGRGNTTLDRVLFERLLACARLPTGAPACDALYAKIARTLGRPDDTERFRRRAEDVLRAQLAADAADWRPRKALGTLLRDFASTRPVFEESLGWFNEAYDRAAGPDRAGILNDRAMTRRCLGDRDGAEKEFNEALGITPDHVQAHTNRSLLLLLRGEYGQGLADYEWRRKKARGQGCDPAAWQRKRVAVWWEQGAGDQIQMARFVRAVREAASHVILVCEASLVDLFRENAVAQEIIPRQKDMQHKDLPAYDVLLPVMSLPFALRLQDEELPWAPIPYLQARPDRLPAPIADMLAKVPDGNLRIGLAWAGNPFLPNDHIRSCPLPAFAPLLRIPGTSWFSLQVGLRHGDAELISAWGLPDFGPHVRSYADTAAAIDRLDLVVAVDTSVSHLAGSLGKKVAVALPFDPDWRWWKEGPRTLWYPNNIALFRQREISEWGPVITDLDQWVRSHLPTR